MKIEIDVEQGPLTALLLRCAQENVGLNDVLNAWIKRAARQPRTVMPGLDQPKAKVLEMQR